MLDRRVHVGSQGDESPSVKKNRLTKKPDSSIDSAESGGNVPYQPSEEKRYERRRDDARLRDEQSLIEAVCEMVPGLLHVYEEDGRLVRWNRHHELVTGYSTEELINFRVEDWFDGEDRIRMAREFPKVFSQGYNQVEMSIKLKDGRKVPYLLTGVRVEIAGKPHLVGIGIDITERKKAQEEREQALRDVERLRELLNAENIYLKKEMAGPFEYDDIIGRSDAMKYVLFRARQVAQTGSTVLVMGETGTGKGKIVRLIHQLSRRKDKPLVMVNCAGLPGTLIESELFGREKGAFTGAEAMQIGRFELADAGTIFMDEIAELPVELQAKLLRVIEDGEFERLGSPHTIKVDVRIIASTNRNLREEVGAGRFREDLFYRLNIFPITMPPLRLHKEDIPLLADYFLKRYNKQFGRQIAEIPEETMRAMQAHTWPGNVRELMGVIERAVITSDGEALHLPESINTDPAVITEEVQSGKALALLEKDHICRVLQETGWTIEGLNGAAQLLGLHPSTLRNRMKKLGIRRPAFSR